MPILGGQIYVEVTANTLPAQASLGAMNERVAASRGAFAGMLSQIGSFVAGQVIFALMARAMMEIEKQAKDVVAKTNAWNDAQAQLNAVLASTHQVAGWTRQDAIDLANAYSNLSTANNVQILGVENLLLTFTAIGKDIMPQATMTVLNMSQALKEDFKSAAIQLGKALQDPILGITALRRVGVNFSAQQKEMVKNWVEHGQKAKAVGLIMNELSTEFGGSATQATTTITGKLSLLSSQFDVIKETLGNDLTPAVSNLLSALLPVFVMVSDKLPGGLDLLGRKWDQFFGTIGRLINQSKGETMPVMLQMSKMFNTTLGPAIQQVGGWIMSTLIPAIVQLQVWFATKIMPVILTVTGIILTDFMPTIEMLAGKILTKLMPPLQRIIGDIMPALIPLFKLLGWVFSNIVGPALGGVIDLIGLLLDGIAWVADKLNYFFSNLQKMKDVGGQVLHAIHVPGFAEGGVTPGGPVMVGERGPEIVSLPAGSRVYPNGTAPAMSSGGTGGSHIVQLNIDGRRFAQVILPSLVDVIRTDAAIRNK